MRHQHVPAVRALNQGRAHRHQLSDLRTDLFATPPPALLQHDVLSLAWRPDGKQLASSTLDGQIYFWDPHEAVLQVRGQPANARGGWAPFRPPPTRNKGTEAQFAVAGPVLQHRDSPVLPLVHVLLACAAAPLAPLQGTIAGRRDIAGGRLRSDRRTAVNSSSGRCFTSLAYSADGSFLLAGGSSKCAGLGVCCRAQWAA